jgi:SAM-dependent methyltransferase
MKLFGLEIGIGKGKGEEGSSCCGPECCAEESAAVPAEGEKIKAMVKEKYAAIARDSKSSACGCGPACCAEVSSFSEGYTQVEGYLPEADLGLGCGLPTETAEIKAGDTVVDLGSGAGNDVFVARSLAGDAGRVIGVDMTPAMIEKAKSNNRKMGYANVEFRLGEIENLPIESGTADVVLSNCVLNLVPDKEKAFREIHRILKPGGHLSVSDIVISAGLPERIRNVAALYAGCVAGAQVKSEYLFNLHRVGFASIRILKEREIEIPDAELRAHLDEEEIRLLRLGGTKVLSITLFAEKPA